MRIRDLLKDEPEGSVYVYAKDLYHYASETYKKAVDNKDERAIITSIWALKDAFEAADMFLDMHEPVDRSDYQFITAQNIYNDCYHKIKQNRITLNGKEIA